MYYRENDVDCFRVNFNGYEKILQFKYLCSNLHVHHFTFSTYLRREYINIEYFYTEISVIEKIFKKDNSEILFDILINIPDDIIREIRKFCSFSYKTNIYFVSKYLKFDFTRSYIIADIDNKLYLCKSTDYDYDRYEILPVAIEIKNLSPKQLLNKYINLTVNMIFFIFIFHIMFYVFYTVKKYYLLNSIFFNSIILYFIYDLLATL